MRVFGSLTNRIAECIPPPNPQVGMGATILMYSDRHAATVVAVKGKSVFVVEDIATRTDKNGMSETQEYSYAPNPNGPTEEFTLRKNGTYVKAGGSMRTGTILRIGERDAYHDFSF